MQVGGWFDGLDRSCSGPEVRFWEMWRCSRLFALESFLRTTWQFPSSIKGASQGQSIYLILRSPVAKKRAVSKEVFWYARTEFLQALFQ